MRETLPHGQTVTTQSSDACRAITTFTAEVLSHGKQAAAVLDAVAADPDCAYAQACAGALFLFLHTRDGIVRAQPYIDAAKARASSASPQEQIFIAAIDAWARTDHIAAADRLRDLILDWPEDLLAAKLSQVHELSLGRAETMADNARRTSAARPGDASALGLLAFAEEQAGDLDAADRAAQDALALRADDPWAQHAMAHLFARRGATDEGLAFLTAASPSWDRCSSFMYTHNWWHLALLHLDRGDTETVLDIFDNRVWSQRRDYVQDQINAISLLLRLDLAGCETGGRWDSVASHAAARTHDHLNGFADLHTIYALARAGRDSEADSMLTSMTSYAARETGPTGQLWRDTALPAAKALLAFARGRSVEAATTLRHLQQALHALGGSTVQRQLYSAVIEAGDVRRRTAAA